MNQKLYFVQLTAFFIFFNEEIKLNLKLNSLYIQPGKINVSEATRKLLPDGKYVIQSRGLIPVKVSYQLS